MLRAGLRLYTTAHPPKASLKLVSELRKLTEVSITKAREALITTNNDLDAALEWLQKDLSTSGARKAAKLAGRTASEGLISIAVLSAGSNSSAPRLGNGGLRSAMVELNCETDFVGRNSLFGKLAADIAHTAAFISEPSDSGETFRPCSLELLNDAPLISQSNPQLAPTVTVGSSIRDLIAKVGEKISLRRAVAVVQNPPDRTRTDSGIRLASYVHGSANLASQGRIGALAVLSLTSPRLPDLMSSISFREDLEKLERSIARQIVGFETHAVQSTGASADETALYEQPFMMLPGGPSNDPVRTVLTNWAQQRGLSTEDDSHPDNGIEVLDFTKWTLGEAASGI